MRRRQFLISASSVLTPLPALALQRAQEVSADFLPMSALLVGATEQSMGEITELDGSSAAVSFDAMLAEAYGRSNVDTLLNLYEKERQAGASPDQIADAILRRAPPLLASISRMTMKIWLFGVWYGTSEAEYIIDNAYKVDFTISARAYANSLVWKMAQAHPMGFSNFAFGSWGEKPPSLQDFGFPA